MDGNNGSSSGSSGSRGSGWKMIFVSPSVNDMLGQKVGELEGKDFLDLVLGMSSNTPRINLVSKHQS